MLGEIPLAQVALEGVGSERRAGRSLDQFAVDNREPLAWMCCRSQRSSGANSPRPICSSRSGHRGARGREQLRRYQRAERVGREIAPSAVIPVDVLQGAVAVG